MDKNVLFTGHSLGGGLACAASLEDKTRKAIVFNSAGVPDAPIGSQLRHFQGYNIGYNIHRYHNKYDILSNLINNPFIKLRRTIVNTLHGDPDRGPYFPWESTTVIDEDEPIGSHYFDIDAHGIDSVLRALGLPTDSENSAQSTE